MLRAVYTHISGSTRYSLKSSLGSSDSGMIDVACDSGEGSPSDDAKSPCRLAMERLNLFASTSPSLSGFDISRDLILICAGLCARWASILSVSGRDIFEDPGNSRRARHLRINVGEAATAPATIPAAPNTSSSLYTVRVCIYRHHVQPCPRPVAGWRLPRCSTSHCSSAMFKKPLTQGASQLEVNANTYQQTPVKRSAVQQRRGLAIHEYRSAALLESVRNPPRY